LCGGPLTAYTNQLRHGPGIALYCAACDLGMLQDQGWADLKTYYDQDYRKRHGPTLNQPSSYQEIFDAYVPYQGSRIECLKPWLHPRARLLEVGCCTGHFLHEVKSLVGEVVGVDYDARAARFASDVCRCRTFGGPLEEAGLEPASFDLVCTFQTMEHVPDPIRFATLLKRYLKPGGTICVEVPSLHDPLLSVFRNPGYRTFHFHEAHLFYFSPASLRAVMERAGFRGEVRGRQDYNVLNHLHWIMSNGPQSTCREGLGPPRLPIADDVEPALRAELEAWIEQVDRQYKTLMAKHGRTENVIFLGTR